MKEISKDCMKPIFQGDIMIVKVKNVPKGNKKLEHNIVAHSETGHHHVAEGCTVLGGLDPMVMFLKADGDFIDIVHQRPFDTHETLRLYSEPGDVFKIKRQREWAPEGWQVVAD